MEESQEGGLEVHKPQDLEAVKVDLVEVALVPRLLGDHQDPSQVVDSNLWGAVSSHQGEVVSSRPGEVVSSHRGAGVPSHRGAGVSSLLEAASHQDSPPSPVGVVLLVSNRVAEALLGPIHPEAEDPILPVEKDPTHRAGVDLWVPILQAVMVPILRAAEGPNLQVAEGPSLQEEEGPIHQAVEGPSPVGPCQKEARRHLAVESVSIPSPPDRACRRLAC